MSAAPVKCFLIEPTGRTNLFLRRFRSGPENDPKCPVKMSYHNAQVFIGQAAEKKVDGIVQSVSTDIYADDPRWPAKCECGYVFSATDPADHDQVFQDSVYRRADTGEERGLREWEKVPGAMWDAYWLHDFHIGPDGKSLIVICPDGHLWQIDGRASNCDSPCKICGKPYHLHNKRGAVVGTNAAGCDKFDDVQPHQCWIRHGIPPNLTVDKNGPTCHAGGGSILTPTWHGFLKNGCLVN